MDLSKELATQFAKTMTNDSSENKESTVYGVVVEYNGEKYVRVDGSDRLTPVLSTADANPGERVTVLIKNHTATVTGNLSSPSARSDSVKDLNSKIDEFGTIVADKASIKELEATKGRIDDLVADTVTIKKDLSASNAKIEELTADNVTVKEKLTAVEADIDNLEATKLNADVADIKYATIKSLEAAEADVGKLRADFADFDEVTTNKIAAVEGSIESLETKKLDAETAAIKYANIDFSNIDMAAVKQFYATSGIIKDIVVEDGTVTGELVGVTIKGDLIEGGTVVADKLVLKGNDGLYYKLNTTGTTVEAEQTPYNSIHGSVIAAQSITASKISVNDLVAFDATIGGFRITTDSIYSGVKESALNTTRGIYLDNNGQIAFGDDTNYLRYYKDQNGKWKLEIAANSVQIKASSSTESGSNLEDVINDMRNEMKALKDNQTSYICIESSRGTTFRNDEMDTILNVTIFRGTERITDIDTLHRVFGDSAYLEWKWLRTNDETYGLLSVDDPRITQNGFKLHVTAEDTVKDVDFTCNLQI